jgi:hypothetical protein
MKISSINSAALQSVIDSIYRVSDYASDETKVNIKERSQEAAVESLASKDSYSDDIRQLDLEERLYRGAKSFKNVLTSTLIQDLEIPDDVYTFLERADNASSSDKNSAGSGYFMTLQGNASEESAQSLYNEISYRYDPSLRFDTGRLVNILV